LWPISWLSQNASIANVFDHIDTSLIWPDDCIALVRIWTG
jgi:hypothetical protein